MFDRNPGDKVEMEKEDGDEGKKISSLGLIEDALKVYVPTIREYERPFT